MTVEMELCSKRPADVCTGRFVAVRHTRLSFERYRITYADRHDASNTQHKWQSSCQHSRGSGSSLSPTKMSAPLKKRVASSEEKLKNESNSSEDSDESSEEFTKGEEIQVDFEGRNPIDADFHGIKQLLHQLFLKAHLNTSELTDLIIGQNYVGSVVKQSDIDGEDSDDETDANDVFGITTVVNITEKQNLECIQQLRALLLQMCTDHATEHTRAAVRALIEDDARPLGLIINERFINIPAQIAVPLLENLSNEMRRATDKKMPFSFGHFVMICKLYKMEAGKVSKKSKGKKQAEQLEIIWSNPEEEVIDQMAECKFEFCVKSDSDSGLSGQWNEDDVPMTPYRRVLILRADQFTPMIDRIKTFLQP